MDTEMIRRRILKKFHGIDGIEVSEIFKCTTSQFPQIHIFSNLNGVAILGDSAFGDSRGIKNIKKMNDKKDKK